MSEGQKKSFSKTFRNIFREATAATGTTPVQRQYTPTNTPAIMSSDVAQPNNNAAGSHPVQQFPAHLTIKTKTASPNIFRRASTAQPIASGSLPPNGKKSLPAFSGRLNSGTGLEAPPTAADQHQNQTNASVLQQQQQKQLHPLARAEPPRPRPARPAGPLRLQLEEWGMPHGVTQKFHSIGVKNLFPWQAAALECGENYNNLVYCAPTSGGKSMVAEILLIRRLMKTARWINVDGFRKVPKYGRALFILPYISVVSEKTKHLEKILEPMQATVRGYYGSEESGQPLAVRGETVAVCTMEKANVCINRLAFEGRLDELVCIVCDELHMVGDPNRGIGLELSLSKVLANPCSAQIQIIAMSATMGGLESLQSWLRAALFITNFRPVPLTERAVFQGTVYRKKRNAVARLPDQKPKNSGAADRAKNPSNGNQQQQQLEQEQQQQQAVNNSQEDDEDDGDPNCPLIEERTLPIVDKRKDPDRLTPLIAEVLVEGHSALVFCGARKTCETCAKMLTELLPKFLNDDPAVRARNTEMQEGRQQLINDMKISTGGAISVGLEEAILAGVAWHHAGLTNEERNGIENGYRAGLIQVLTATSTLAAGINLPARRVILRSLQQGIGPVPRSQYLQMVGRAGRTGQSAIGESFIIGKGPENSQDWDAICNLITEPVPYIRSQLLPADADTVTDFKTGFSDDHTACLQRLLLEGIASGVVKTGHDVGNLLMCTFAAHQRPDKVVAGAASAALNTLQNKRRLIKWAAPVGSSEYIWMPTTKGKAIYDSGLPLDMGQELFDQLKEAGMGASIGSPLHLVYAALLDHPFSVVNWARWLYTLEHLPRQHRELAERLQVNKEVARQALGGKQPNKTVKDRHSRFAAALCITDLLGDLTPAEAEVKWGAPEFMARSSGLSRGQLQKFLTDASKTLAMAGLLCDSADWWQLATLYSNLSQNAAAGVRHELLPLMKVDGMNPSKARALYKAGIRDVLSLATADLSVVEKALAAGMNELRVGSDKPTTKNGAAAGDEKDNRGGQTKGKGVSKYAATAVASRAAKTLMASARERLDKDCKLAEAEQQQMQLEALADKTNLLPINDKLTRAASDEDKEIRKKDGTGYDDKYILPGDLKINVDAKAAMLWTGGMTKVVELRSTSSDEEIEAFFEEWSHQPVWSIVPWDLNGIQNAATSAGNAVVGGGGNNRRQKRPSLGIAVCWNMNVVYFLDLTLQQLGRELGESEETGYTLESALQQQLASTRARKICYNIADSFPLLAYAGLEVQGPIHDPRIAGWLINPQDSTKYSLEALKLQFAHNTRIWVQRASRGSVHAAAKRALVALSIYRQANNVLLQQGLLDAYNHIELPAAQTAARINSAVLWNRAGVSIFEQSEAEMLTAALESSMVPPLDKLCDPQNFGEIARHTLEEDAAGRGNEWQDTVVDLLNSLKLPVPIVRSKDNRPVKLTNNELLAYLAHRHVRRELAVCLVQRRLTQQNFLNPLHKLIDPPSIDDDTSSNSDAAENTPEHQQLNEVVFPPRLTTTAPSAIAGLSYGYGTDKFLQSLLPGVALPCEIVVSSIPLEGEVAQGAIDSYECVIGCGVLVQTDETESGLVGLDGVGASAGCNSTSPGERFMYTQQQQQLMEKITAVGVVVGVKEKRLQTALNFEGSGGCDTVQVIQRSARGPPMLEVRLIPPQSMPFGYGATVVKRGDQIWRLAGHSAAVFGSSISSSLDKNVAPPLPATQSFMVQLAHLSGGALINAALLNAHTGAVKRPIMPDAATTINTLLTVEVLHPELLALAKLSSEPDLLDAFNQPDPLSHVSACWSLKEGQVAAAGGALICPKTVAAVSKAIAYGWSSSRLSDELRLGKKDPAAMLSSFIRSFPKVSSWWQSVGKSALSDGCIKTLSGRVKQVIDNTKGDAKLRGKLYKSAVAYVVGGTAADICKAAMVAVDECLRQENHDHVRDGGGQSSAKSDGLCMVLEQGRVLIACVRMDRVKGLAAKVIESVSQLKIGGSAGQEGGEKGAEAARVRLSFGKSLSPLDRMPL